MKKIYVIYRGRGMDSGFGGYCSNWEEAPLTLNGDAIWFNDQNIAKKVVGDLNSKAVKEFYRAGLSDSYDGNFPVEYEYREIVIPDNSPSDLNSFQELVNQEFVGWDWFSNVGFCYKVSKEVKDEYPHLCECASCEDFGYKPEDLNNEGICKYCEEDEDN